MIRKHCGLHPKGMWFVSGNGDITIIGDWTGLLCEYGYELSSQKDMFD